MKETNAIVQRLRDGGKGYQIIEMWIEPELYNMKAGQSVLVRRADAAETWDPYLRDQWWPTSVSNSHMIVERPAHEKYPVGTELSLMGPIGQPFRFRRNLRNVLLIAQDTPPTPLRMMIPPLLSNNIAVTLVLLGAARTYPIAMLPPEVEVIRGEGNPGDTLNWQDVVTSVGIADQVFALVPPDDEHLRFAALWNLFNELRATTDKNLVFGVFQGLLPCGVGACQACMVRHKGEGDKYVCTDGPAFDLHELKL